MNAQHHYSLAQYNTFAIPAISPAFYTPSSIADLDELTVELKKPFYILGEGSNTLFVDHFSPIIIKPSFTGIRVEDKEHEVLLTVQSGENWHQLVMFCLENGYHGLENLALIPGSVGAAPVQNIGAYGVELADTVEHVTWYDFSTKQVSTLTNQQCQFSYRNSIFKQSLSDTGLIVAVTLRLSKQWQPKLTYRGLDTLAKGVSAKEVVQQVIAIRQAKLPDPVKIPNAGSFFKNPIVSAEQFNNLKSIYCDIPAYPQDDGKIKLAAGWLIEQAGLKGFRAGDVGVHKHQALVLVNFGSECGQDIIELAQLVQAKVQEKFQVILEPEVRLLTELGLTTLNECK